MKNSAFDIAAVLAGDAIGVEVMDACLAGARRARRPRHGNAPDIAGTRKANPTAMFLSAAMMLDHSRTGDARVSASRVAGTRRTKALGPPFWRA
jgi:3-isopropylmalate dehydrogenase